MGVDAGAEADFDAWAEGLDVGYCGDAGVVDFALRVRRCPKKRSGIQLLETRGFEESARELQGMITRKGVPERYGSGFMRRDCVP